MSSHNYYVYIMTNEHRTTLYIGMSNDVERRISEHRLGINKKSFTYQYNLTRLVYYEHHTDVNIAIAREKKLKRWQRIWKDELITKMNPKWHDLFDDLTGSKTSGDPG